MSKQRVTRSRTEQATEVVVNKVSHTPFFSTSSILGLGNPPQHVGTSKKWQETLLLATMCLNKLEEQLDYTTESRHMSYSGICYSFFPFHQGHVFV
jgi:hypothetical protein